MKSVMHFGEKKGMFSIRYVGLYQDLRHIGMVAQFAFVFNTSAFDVLCVLVEEVCR